MRYPKTTIVLVVLAAAIAYSYSWTCTPYGRLDYRAAVSLHLLTFPYTIQPDPNSDFEMRLPINLIYSLSSMLPSEAVSDTRDVEIPGKAGAIPARVYWPAKVDRTKPSPVIVYFHGGGFVLGSVDIFDQLARSLSNATDAMVISVDYRLAPVHPFPAAVDDCDAAVRWAAKNAASLGGDATKLVVAGDSAGGNLAAVVSLKERDEGGPALFAQLLYYPGVDLTDARYESKDRFGDGYGLSREQAAAFHSAYVASADPSDPYLSPLYAESLAGLPPVLLVTGGFDPLTSAANAYGERLEQAGVPMTRLHFPKMVHGFMSVRLFSQRREALNGTRRFLDGLSSGRAS